MSHNTPGLDDPRVLRYVEVDSGLVDVPPYRILMWDTYETYPGEAWRTKVACAFYRSPEPDLTKPFMVSYCGPGMGQCVDSDAMVQCALGCFTMSEDSGVGEEWFADYTDEQIAWRDSYACEALSFLQDEFTSGDEDQTEHDGRAVWHTDDEGNERLCERNGDTYAPVFKDLIDW